MVHSVKKSAGRAWRQGRRPTTRRSIEAAHRSEARRKSLKGDDKDAIEARTRSAGRRLRRSSASNVYASAGSGGAAAAQAGAGAAKARPASRRRRGGRRRVQGSEGREEVRPGRRRAAATAAQDEAGTATGAGRGAAAGRRRAAVDGEARLLRRARRQPETPPRTRSRRPTASWP
jgi:hypothetical protein